MKIDGVTSTYLNPLLLIVWFFIWGICPWSNAAAHPGEAPTQSHHQTDHTHHASKGSEHSCSGSISYSKSDLGSDRLLNPAGAIEATIADDISLSGRHDPSYFFELTSLPRLLTAYYQLYSVYRI